MVFLLILVFTKIFFRLGRKFGDIGCFMPLGSLAYEENTKDYFGVFQMRFNTFSCYLNIFQCQLKDGTLNTLCNRTLEGQKIFLNFYLPHKKIVTLRILNIRWRRKYLQPELTKFKILQQDYRPGWVWRVKKTSHATVLFKCARFIDDKD